METLKLIYRRGNLILSYERSSVVEQNLIRKRYRRFSVARFVEILQMLNLYIRISNLLYLYLDYLNPEMF